MQKKAQKSTHQKKILRKKKRSGRKKKIIKLGSPEFIALQKHWYSKLADSGFSDLEWVDHKTGRGHNSFIKPEDPKVLNPHTFQSKQNYYLIAENYLMHCNRLQGADRFMFKLHVAGHTYEQVRKAYNKTYKPSLSIYTIYYRIQEIVKKCMKWNKVSKYGRR